MVDSLDLKKMGFSDELIEAVKSVAAKVSESVAHLDSSVLNATPKVVDSQKILVNDVIVHSATIELKKPIR